MSTSSTNNSEHEEGCTKVLLGHITGVYGLKGWVKVHSDTNPRENILRFARWWIEKREKGDWVDVLDGRPQGKTLVARLKGITTPEQADVFIGSTIAVNRSAMPTLQPGEYYWSDLIGMQVLTLKGIRVGPVHRLFETGANDVMVVKDERVEMAACNDGANNSSSGKELAGNKTDAGKKTDKEILVPWLVPDVITEINQQDNTITIDWDPDF